MRKVRCYWNLHRHMWSVQDYATRRIIGHAYKVLLRDVAFTVSEAGRQRVLRDKRKNVHAFAVGYLEAADWLTFEPFRLDWQTTRRANDAYARFAAECGQRVSYNPYKAGHFYIADQGDGTPRIDGAPMAFLARTMGRVFACDPCDMTLAQSREATQ